MKSAAQTEFPTGTKAMILSKYYYGVLTKSLESLDVERYFSVLYFLNFNNGCSQQFICNNLAVDKTAMVKIVNFLLNARFITRKVNPDDRREHFIFLTRKGVAQTSQIVRSFRKIDEQIFNKISERERNIFNKVLDQITERLKLMPADDLFFNYKKTKAVKAAGSTNKMTGRKSSK